MAKRPLQKFQDNVRTFRSNYGFLPRNRYKGPEVNTRTDHSISIRVSGRTIGRIQEWSPNQSRNVSPIYELDSAGKGNIIEQIPATMSAQTINITRYDLYQAKMEEIWGSSILDLLCDQHTPFRINERWDNPGYEVEMWAYVGCWFTSLGRSHSAAGDRITRVNATLAYTDKYQVSKIDIAGDELTERQRDLLSRKTGDWF